MDILTACRDPKLFRPWFKDPTPWAAWRAFLAALFGLPMSDDEAAIYRACTGLEEPPTAPTREGWLVCGRRSGKSFTMALVAVYLAAFKDYRPYLQPGERATVMVIAADRKQARIILRYVAGILNGVSMLKRMVERETAEGFDLRNAVTIEVASASFRGVRGYTLAAALLDEVAFWRSEDSANPDAEILAALRPAMVTIPHSVLLAGSSPYARRGALWDAYRRHYGEPDGPLVWRAPTRVMNPTVPQSVIDEAMERDPAAASAEYLAEFRQDVDDFVSREVVERCVEPGVVERPPVAGVSYTAFVDPSGGSKDAMTLAIAHREGERGVLDAIRERKPPFSPEAVVSEFAALLKGYGIGRVRGDRYAGEWPREAFRRHGIAYDLAEKPRSDLYRDLLPALNSGRVDLLDSARLVSQLVGLERRTARGGKDSIDHAPGGHDDVANAVAGVLDLTAKPKREFEFYVSRPLSPLDFGLSRGGLAGGAGGWNSLSRRGGGDGMPRGGPQRASAFARMVWGHRCAL